MSSVGLNDHFFVRFLPRFIGKLVLRPPPAASPYWVVRVALLELDPHARIIARQSVEAHAVSGEGDAGQRPAAGLLPQHIRHTGLDAPHLQRVLGVRDDPAVFAVERLAHAVSLSFLAPRLSRLSSRLCVYCCVDLLRSMLCVTCFT